MEKQNQIATTLPSNFFYNLLAGHMPFGRIGRVSQFIPYAVSQKETKIVMPWDSIVMPWDSKEAHE